MKKRNYKKPHISEKMVKTTFFLTQRELPGENLLFGTVLLASGSLSGGGNGGVNA